MNKKLDATEALTALISELRKLPDCEPAMLYLGDFTELLERRTRFVVLRAGLMMSIASYLSLLGIHYFQHRGAEIEPGLIIVTTIFYGLVLAVVSLLDYRLQHRPLRSMKLRNAHG